MPNTSSLVKIKDYNIITQKLMKLKINLQIIIMRNILLLESLISLQQNIFLQTMINSKVSIKQWTQTKKHLLVENELKNRQTFDSSYFKDKSHFEEDGSQNYLVFQPM